MPRKTDKRIRLIEAAKALIHHQGFNLTTLADIAQEADVPLGNVYYYFKTKEAIGFAVIEKRNQEWTARLSSWSQHNDPLVRLMALLQYNLEDLETMARYGCEVGGLCQELGKQGGLLADQAAKLLHDTLKWTEEQFDKLGFGEKSASYALDFISNIQGMLLLTHTFKDPQIAQREAGNLHLWLESITARKVDAPARVVQVVEEEEEEEAFA